MDQRELTAHHEAGHAVVAYRLGFEVGPVTITATDETLGLSLSEGAWADGSRDEDCAVVYLAGHEAELLLDPAADSAGSRSDFEEAEHLLGSQDFEPARRRARELLTASWEQVRAVAQLLLEEETLGYGWDIVVSAIDEDEDWRALWARHKAISQDLRYPWSGAQSSQPT